MAWQTADIIAIQNGDATKAAVAPPLYVADWWGCLLDLEVNAISGSTAMVDSSGNGQHGTYNADAKVVFEVDGLVVGDKGIAVGHGTGLFGASAPLAPGFLTGGNLWACHWIGPGYTGGGTFSNWGALTLIAASLGAVFNLGVNWNGGGTQMGLTVYRQWGNAFGQADAIDSAMIAVTPGAPHFVMVTYQAGTDQYRFYIDGALIDTRAGGGHGAGIVDPNTTLVAPDIGAPLTTFDEVAFGSGLPSGAAIANLYTQSTVSFAAYSAAVLALTPRAYYHLDDVPAMHLLQLEMIWGEINQQGDDLALDPFPSVKFVVQNGQPLLHAVSHRGPYLKLLIAESNVTNYNLRVRHTNRQERPAELFNGPLINFSGGTIPAGSYEVFNFPGYVGPVYAFASAGGATTTGVTVAVHGIDLAGRDYVLDHIYRDNASQYQQPREIWLPGLACYVKATNTDTVPHTINFSLTPAYR